MKILMYQWKVYHQQDILEALQECGHEVETISDRPFNYNDDPDFVEMLAQKITEGQYDCMFSVNYFGVVSDACQKCRIRYLVWTCDSPLITMHHESVFNDCNNIFIFDKVNYFYYKQMGLPHVWYLPLAVNTGRLDGIMFKESEEDKRKFASDISFIGSMYRKNSYDDLKPHLPEYLKGYFDAAMLAQIEIFGDDLISKLMTDEILQELEQFVSFEQGERSLSSLPLVFQSTFLGFKMAQIERIRNLNLLGEKFLVDVYSDGEDERLSNVRYRGSVNYHTDMPKVFHESKINLNFTIRNIKSGIPLRGWDILGCGGFLLTNFQAEIPMYFENGKDLVYYEDTNDLMRKAEYYLSHEEERRAIALNGYRKVKAQHSYQKRIQQMLACLQL